MPIKNLKICVFLLNFDYNYFTKKIYVLLIRVKLIAQWTRVCVSEARSRGFNFPLNLGAEKNVKRLKRPLSKATDK